MFYRILAVGAAIVVSVLIGTFLPANSNAGTLYGDAPVKGWISHKGDVHMWVDVETWEERPLANRLAICKELMDQLNINEMFVADITKPFDAVFSYSRDKNGSPLKEGEFV